MMCNARSSISWLLALAVLAWGVGPALAQTDSRVLTLESVEVEPPDIFTEKVVDNLLPLRPGNPVDAARLLEVQRVLESSGAFDSLTLYTSRGTRPGQVVLHVGVRLASGVRLETGFGHEFPTGWYVNVVGARWVNPLRRGDHLRFGFRFGLRRVGFYGRLEEPRLGGSAFDGLVAFDSETELWSA